MKPREKALMKEKLEATKEAERKHTIVMTRVAARGGLTLKEMRALPKTKKDTFIFTYRDGGQYDTEGVLQ